MSVITGWKLYSQVIDVAVNSVDGLVVGVFVPGCAGLERYSVANSGTYAALTERLGQWVVLVFEDFEAEAKDESRAVVVAVGVPCPPEVL